MYISRGSRAFALPTVLIASIVMMLILLSGLTALVSTRTAQLASYETRLTKEASESGMSFAKACMAANGNKVTWTNSKPLKPNTDCTGTESIACTNTSSDARCFVVNQGNYRTSFEVTYTANASNVITDITSRGVTSTVRSTSKATASYRTEVIKLKLSNGTTLGSSSGILPASAFTASPGSLNCVTQTQNYNSGQCTVYNTPGGVCGIISGGEVMCAGQAGYIKTSTPYALTGFCNTLVGCDNLAQNDVSMKIKNWSSAGQPFNGKKAIAVAATPGTICVRTINCQWGYSQSESANNIVPAATGAVCIATDQGELLCAGPNGVNREGSYTCNPYVNPALTTSSRESDCNGAMKVKNWSASGQPFNGKTIVSVYIPSNLSDRSGGYNASSPVSPASWASPETGICGLTDTGEIICTAVAHFGYHAYCNSLVNEYTAYKQVGSWNDSFSGPYTSACANSQERTNSVKNWSASGQPFNGKKVVAFTASPGVLGCMSTTNDYNSGQCQLYNAPGGICGVIDNGEVICAGQAGFGNTNSSINFCNGFVLTDCNGFTSGDMSIKTKNWSTTGQPFNGKKAVAIAASPGNLCVVYMHCNPGYTQANNTSSNYPMSPGAICIATDQGEVICTGMNGIYKENAVTCNPYVNPAISSTSHETACNGSIATKNWSASGQVFNGKKIVSVYIPSNYNDHGGWYNAAASPANELSPEAGLCGLTDSGEIICTAVAHFAYNAYCNSLVTNYAAYAREGSSNDYYANHTPYSPSCADNTQNTNIVRNWSSSGQPFSGKKVGISASGASPSGVSY